MRFWRAMIDQIEFDKKGAKLILSGEISSQEIMDANRKLINHPDFPSFQYELWIFRSVIDFKLTADQIRLLAEQDKKASAKNPDLKVAIVTVSSLTFGMSRMYEALYGEGRWQTKIFSDQADAEKWINA